MQLSVCLAYIHHKAEDDFLRRSLEVMLSYAWVGKVVVVHTDRNDQLVRQGRVTHYYQQFGAGFGKQPEDGGFNEIAARNFMLLCAQHSRCTWTLVCDSDEIYLPGTLRWIQQAELQRKNLIWFPCYHFCSPHQYLWWPNLVKQDGMHDPHPRAVRTMLNIKYVLNANNRFREKLRNRTAHCHLQDVRRANRLQAKGDICHVHTRHMFDPKRPKAEWFRSQKPRVFEGTLPDPITAAFKEQDNDAYRLRGIS